MTEYPKIQRILASCDSAGDRHSFTMDKPYWTALATELRALLAERDALTAKVPTPVRKLREYKGVTYADGRWWFKGLSCDTAARVITIVCGFTDADHAAIYALREQPYEPVETVEDIVRDVVRCGTMDFIDSYAARLRAAVAAEGVRDA